MADIASDAETPREPVLNPVDRISEMLFGLLMALSFTGAVSVADSGQSEIREMFIAAFGCNLAWGIVDAVMYMVRTVTDRGKALTLVRSVRATPDAGAGRALIETSLGQHIGKLVGTAEVEAIRGRIVALSSIPAKPRLHWDDFVAGFAVFLLVVAATFPVVLPFALMNDVGAAKNLSRAIALVMLFGAGLGLGRYAGYGSWRTGFIMAGLGLLLVGAIKALGG